MARDRRRGPKGGQALFRGRYWRHHLMIVSPRFEKGVAWVLLARYALGILGLVISILIAIWTTHW
jgi:hypothetical protein